MNFFAVDRPFVLRVRVVSWAMVPEGTPGKWSLWATHPARLGGIAELYATQSGAQEREVALKRDGYTVAVTLSKLRAND